MQSLTGKYTCTATATLSQLINLLVARIILTALKQVVRVPGDLHGGRFHFLAVIYHFWFRGFLQVFQMLLGWKRISRKDVSKCFQQALQLACIIFGEVERAMQMAFVVKMYHGAITDKVVDWVISENDFALQLSKCHISWVKLKIKATTREVFHSNLQFMLLMRWHRIFCSSV